jgi:hypothetical protein
MVTGALAQDGARAYQLLPKDSKLISLSFQALHSVRTDPSPGVFESTVDVYVVTPTYIQLLDIGGNTGAFMIGLPIGTVEASADTMMGLVEDSTDVAQGDLVLTGVIGLVGSPALTLQEYVQYQPGLQLGLVGKLNVPTGAYDESEQLNIGSNRWAAQIGVPITYVLGKSMLDPELMTFELMPSVRLYADNTDAYGPTDVLSQDPLFALEGHITRNFNPMIWASLDSYVKIGGETYADGVSNDDAQQSLALGATLGVNLSPQIQVKVAYDQVVASNLDDATDSNFKLTSYFKF